MAEEKKNSQGQSAAADRLRATVELMEQRAQQIPSWMLGTIVFAEHPRQPATNLTPHSKSSSKK